MNWSCSTAFLALPSKCWNRRCNFCRRATGIESMRASKTDSYRKNFVLKYKVNQMMHFYTFFTFNRDQSLESEWSIWQILMINMHFYLLIEIYRQSTIGPPPIQTPLRSNQGGLSLGHYWKIMMISSQTSELCGFTTFFLFFFSF